MDDRALDHALEAGGGLGLLADLGDEVVELRVDVLDEVAPEQIEIDVARPHDGGRVLILDEGQQQVFKRRIFLTALVGVSQSLVQGLFEATGE